MISAVSQRRRGGLHRFLVDRTSWIILRTPSGEARFSLISKDSTLNLVQAIGQKEAHVGLLLNNVGIGGATTKVEKGNERGQPRCQRVRSVSQFTVPPDRRSLLPP
ncbi:hypothetical protein BDN67DRAFT_964761 [Paxillus ammoniavirescens]|nr:hypothetical protein BDN67DRAFT_964761 [Paxillus ammoniavirescens]